MNVVRSLVNVAVIYYMYAYCRIIFRIRQLHIIRWQMLVDHKKQIMKGVSAKSLGLLLPKPEDKPPTLWWIMDCDHSLVVGILKHGKAVVALYCTDTCIHDIVHVHLYVGL